MDINSVNSVGPIRPNSPFPFETDPKAEPTTFGEMLKAAVESVNGQIADADKLTLKMAMGDVKDVHEVMLAMEKASLSLQLTIEIRNKIVEAYQSIMRQQI